MAGLLVWAAGIPAAQTPPPDAAAARRILDRHCVSCHGAARLAGLDLRSRDGLLRGGARGAAVVPGNSGRSLLFDAVTGSGALKMPPGGKPLPAQSVEILRRWIDGGALWAGDSAGAAAEPSWWSLRKVKRPPTPPVNDSGWIRNPVDAFILSALENNGLKPAPAAAKSQLARRVYFDLLGLPPAPEDLSAFLVDNSAESYERLVERLLESPHYGERWGRHWLDVVRYADTGGYQTDLYFKDAWRYRDYVIHAFNADKPYDRFVQEQVAGDEIWPDNLDLEGSYHLANGKRRNMEARLGTGLYTVSPVYHESGLDAANYFDMQWTDWVDTTGSVFLGLTLGCARCHDHKFDPVSQRDYFRMRAIFAGSDRVEVPLVHRMDLFDQWQFYPKQVLLQQLRAEVDRLMDRARQAVVEARKAKFTTAEREAFATPESKRSAEQQKLAVRVEASIASIPVKDIVEQMTVDEKNLRDGLIARIGDGYLETLKPMGTATLLGHTETIPDVHVLARGDYRQKGEKVSPGLPSVIAGDFRIEEPPGVAVVPRRRKALAQWLTHPEHPLTARVMVNRIWQGHFGRGITGTPNDFGRQGEPPTHPELLDWLAAEFVARNWSIKQLHRLILLSNTYRMSSRHDSTAASKDPDNRLYWRMNPRRLDAESIWDATLAVSGTLTRKADPMRFHRKSNQPDIGLLNPMGGPPVFPALSADEMEGGDLLDKSQWPESPDPRDQTRRAVYVYVKRSFSFPLFTVFDAPDAALSCGRRQTTTVAPQSLALLNNGLIQRRAKAFAARLIREGGGPNQWIYRAWTLALGRLPSAAERDRHIAFLEAADGSASAAWAPSKAELGDVPPDLGGRLAKLCLAIFNFNEFLYVD
jgi:hypothetical protein